MASLVKPEQLHMILIPLFCQSASTPMTELGLLLANRGVNVTIITTNYNLVLYKSSIELANTTSKLSIRLLSLDPPGKLTNDSMRRQALEKLVQDLVPPPSCMVSSDIWGTGYTHEIACKFKITCYVFCPRSCFSTTCTNKIAENKLLDTINPYTDSFLVQDIPHKVELKGYQSPFFKRVSKVGENQIRVGILNTTVKPYPIRGLLVNNFEEMEPCYFGQLRKQYSNAWGIGPVSLCHKEISDKINRGQKASIDANHCLNWLDSMKTGSVVYACFGSLSCIQPSQLVEIGLGLESSNQPFIWVIRDTKYSAAEIGRWLETNKFEKRVEGRGLVIRGWAPQLIILSHPSIGGFFTHCGWNSTLEGVCGGIPMITWPMFEEQHVNEKFVTDVLGIGVSIFVEARLSSEEVIVKSDRVKEAIEELMNGEKAGEMKRRARELGELANKAVEEGGSSHSNITKFIQDVMHIMKEEEVKRMPCKKFKCESRPSTNTTAFEILVRPFHMLSYCHGVDISVKFKKVFQAWNKNDYITAYAETRCWKLQTRKRRDSKRTTIHNGWLQFRDDLQLAVGDLCMFEWKNDTVRNFNVRIVKKVPVKD